MTTATRPMSERPKVIDMRCRLTTTKSASYFRQRTQHSGRYGEIAAFGEGTPEAFFKELDTAGVTTAVSTSGMNKGMKLGYQILPDRTVDNDEQAEIQRRYPARFVACAGIDAWRVFHDPLKELERCKAMGFKVAFIEPGRAPGFAPNLADARLYPIYQKCVDLDMALCPQTSGMLGGLSIDYADPKWIDQVAEDFPDLRIICGHGCPPYNRELAIVCGRRENVYASPDSYLRNVHTEEWVEMVNNNSFDMRHKFIWGSSYPLGPIKPYADFFFSLPWKDEVLDDICWRNAIKAMKLDEVPAIKKLYGV